MSAQQKIYQQFEKSIVHLNISTNPYSIIFCQLRQTTPPRNCRAMEDSISRDLAQQPIALVDKKPFTVSEFISAIPDLPQNLIRPNLKKAIEVAVRDKIVAQQALKKGFANDPVVQEQLHRSTIVYQYYAALSGEDKNSNQKINLLKYYEENK